MTVYSSMSGKPFMVQSITLRDTLGAFECTIGLADDGKHITWKHSNGDRRERIPLSDAGSYSDVAIRKMSSGVRWEKAQFTYTLKHKHGGIYKVGHEGFYIL